MGISFTGTGPFSGDPNGQMKATYHTHGRSYGLVTSESDAQILDALIMLKAASRHQLSELLGLSNHSLKKSIPRLSRLGFIDRIETGRTPPLYVLGPESRALFKLKKEEWHILKAFRIAASNQLFVMLKCVWPDMEYTVEPHQGLTAQMRAGDIEFGIIAPRLWPGETTWAREMAELAPDNIRLLIVAGSREYAEECARVIKTQRPIRFTWDGLLKENIIFYRKAGNKLVAAEDLTPEEPGLTEKVYVI